MTTYCGYFERNENLWDDVFRNNTFRIGMEKEKVRSIFKKIDFCVKFLFIFRF
jgi:hypothetical protein